MDNLIKIQSFRHQLEINLIEEKHKEEKRLFEIKLAQATQKSSMLEAQLNSYRKSKNQLIEQLYTMMQKQWQQALLIISGKFENRKIFIIICVFEFNETFSYNRRKQRNFIFFSKNRH